MIRPPKMMAHQGKIAMEPKWSSGGLCYQWLPRWCVFCVWEVIKKKRDKPIGNC